MQGIFINYRREDSEGYAIILQERLAKHFGENQVFMDVDNIEPGIDFMHAIENSLSSCEVMLVLIGARWLDAIDEQGNRRLDNPNDPLRIEIETKLNSNARVIPVLLRGITMPKSDKLPPSLAPLTRRHAIEISSSRRDYDLERLLTTLEKVPGLKPLTRHDEKKTTEAGAAPKAVPPAPPPRSKALKHGFIGGGIAILLLVTLALFDTEETVTPPASDFSVYNNTTVEPVNSQLATPPTINVSNLAAPDMADVQLSGTWYDDDGIRYESIQTGNKILATGFNDLLFGTAVRQIIGTIHDNTIKYTIQDGFTEMDGIGVLNEDGQHIDYTISSGNYRESGQLHLNHSPN